MKKIVVYFDEPEFNDYPLNKHQYRAAYADLQAIIESRGGEMYIARGPESYAGNGRFHEVYSWSGGATASLVQNLQADIIFDKGPRSTLESGDFQKVNNDFIDRLCNDKRAIYDMFEDSSPKSLAVSDALTLEEALDQIPGEIKVFKPADGFGGEGIVIATKERILQEVGPEALKDSMVQEFIDTEGGIPGIVDGHHDFRVIIVNGAIVQASFRQPAVGSLLANVTAGGKISFIDLKQVPQNAKELALRIDEGLERYGSRIYSVDMVFDGSEFRLIELNSRPGINPAASGKHAERLLSKIADCLLSS